MFEEKCFTNCTTWAEQHKCWRGESCIS